MGCCGAIGHLLRHAADARAAGRPMDRAALRRFTAGADEQLVLWALLPQAEEHGELVLEDGAGLDCLDAGVRPVGGDR